MTVRKDVELDPKREKLFGVLDPDETDPGKVPRNLRETLRELLGALNVYLNPYDANNEHVVVEQLGLIGFRKTKFAGLLEKSLHRQVKS